MNTYKDSGFPGLALAFDMDKIKPVFEEFYKKNYPEISVQSCQVADVRYEPGSQCTLLYRITGLENSLNKELLFLGKVLKANEEAQSLPKETIYSKSMGIAFIPFPYDPCLPWLQQVYCPKIMKERLSVFFWEKNWNIIDLTISLLAYVPQMRATFLYKIEAEDRVTQKTNVFEWIAKTNLSKIPQRVYANYWALWSAAEGRILMPKPTGFLLNPQLTFQEKINGTRLGARVNVPHKDQLFKGVAEGIAHFHNLKIPLTSTRKLESEIKNLTRWSDILMNLRPDLRKRMEFLKDSIISEMAQRFSVEAPIHADFHHTNILVDDERVQIIDMDEMAYGDPCVDLGRFLSSLRIPSLRAFGSFDGLKSQRELFIETYLKHSPREQSKIHLFEAASLFTSAASTFRMQRKNWENEIPLFLEESETAFRKSKQGKSFSQITNAFYPRLSKAENLKWIKDGQYVKTLLAPHFYEKYKLEIIGCRFVQEQLKSTYNSFQYAVLCYQTDQPVEKTINLFVHNGKEGRFAYNYVVLLHEGLTQTDSPLHVPVPIAYLPEVGALAFEATPGSPITQFLETSQADHIAEILAQGLLALHDIETGSQSSYILKNISPYNIKYDGDALHVEFPLRKNIGKPQTDIDNFCKKLREYGGRKDKVKDCETFIEIFARKS